MGLLRILYAPEFPHRSGAERSLTHACLRSTNRDKNQLFATRLPSRVLFSHLAWLRRLPLDPSPPRDGVGAVGRSRAASGPTGADVGESSSNARWGHRSAWGPSVCDGSHGKGAPGEILGHRQQDPGRRRQGRLWRPFGALPRTRFAPPKLFQDTKL